MFNFPQFSHIYIFWSSLTFQMVISMQLTFRHTSCSTARNCDI